MKDDEATWAKATVDRFLAKFDAGHRPLTLLASLPLILTPQLVHYLRISFLRGQTPWVAEVDLLLSDLCQTVGFEQYALKSPVREFLISELKRSQQAPVMQQAAALLLAYVRREALAARRSSQPEWEAQQWSAMLFLEDEKHVAARQIAQAFARIGETAGEKTANADQEPELARLARLTEFLAPQLEHCPELVEYARTVGELLDRGDVTTLQVSDSDLEIYGVPLPAPETLVPGTGRDRPPKTPEPTGPAIPVEISQLMPAQPNWTPYEESLAILDRAWASETPNKTNAVWLVGPANSGKLVAIRHWIDRMASDGYRGAERVFFWDFGQSSTAREFFFEVAHFLLPGLTNPKQCVSLLRRSRTLLVLYGLEAAATAETSGERSLDDRDLTHLLKSLGEHNEGLLIAASQIPLREFVSTPPRTEVLKFIADSAKDAILLHSTASAKTAGELRGIFLVRGVPLQLRNVKDLTVENPIREKTIVVLFDPAVQDRLRSRQKGYAFTQRQLSQYLEEGRKLILLKPSSQPHYSFDLPLLRDLAWIELPAVWNLDTLDLIQESITRQRMFLFDLQSELTFEQYSMKVGEKNGREWFEWCIFAAGPEAILADIESIEYLLNSDFAEPLRRGTDRKDGFACYSNGWGGFRVEIAVCYSDGRRDRTTHKLQLKRSSWPLGPRPDALDADEQKVYSLLLDDRYRWRKTKMLAKQSNLPLDAVGAILNKLEGEGYVRISPIPSSDNLEMWGATAEVGLPPRFEKAPSDEQTPTMCRWLYVSRGTGRYANSFEDVAYSTLYRESVEFVAATIGTKVRSAQIDELFGHVPPAILHVDATANFLVNPPTLSLLSKQGIRLLYVDGYSSDTPLEALAAKFDFVVGVSDRSRNRRFAFGLEFFKQLLNAKPVADAFFLARKHLRSYGKSAERQVAPKMFSSDSAGSAYFVDRRSYRGSRPH